MASAISGDLQTGILAMGQNGRKLQWGQGAFVTTATSATIPVQMHMVESVILTYIGSVSTDPLPTWTDTTSGGMYQVSSTGNVTIGRGAALTSGQKFSYLIIGK